MSTNQKGFTVVEIILVVALLGVLGFVGWNAYQNSQNHEPSQSSKSTPTPSATPGPDAALPAAKSLSAERTEFTSPPEFKFSLSYPKAYTAAAEYYSAGIPLEVYGGYSWNINKGQQSFFTIDAIPASRVAEYTSRNYQASGKKVVLPNGDTAEKVKLLAVYDGYRVDKDGYSYFVKLSDVNQKAEFLDILLTLKLQ